MTAARARSRHLLKELSLLFCHNTVHGARAIGTAVEEGDVLMYVICGAVIAGLKTEIGLAFHNQRQPPAQAKRRSTIVRETRILPHVD
jgi:hypothetical protein